MALQNSPAILVLKLQQILKTIMRESKYTHRAVLSKLLLIIIVVLTGFDAIAGAQVPIGNRQAIIQLAKRDPVLLLEKTKSRYQDSITDYTGTLYRQERIAGKLGAEQVVSFKFRAKPFSVYMQWQKNAGPIDRLLYVEGQNDNKMVVHPTGLFCWLKSVKKDPRCKQALQTSLYTCDQFGFGRMIERVSKIYQQAQSHGDVKKKCLGLDKVDDRECIVIEAALPQKADYPCGRLVMKIDIGYLLPVYVASYDWNGKLISEYIYTDLKFNTGLTEQQFTRKANRL